MKRSHLRSSSYKDCWQFYFSDKINKNADIKLVSTTRFLNNLHHVRSTPECLKANTLKCIESKYTH